ncbi:DUF742 domain-containing protein [Planotetraspora sp. A-T 1434]|uniref:DUF742 domain-containing protein n=1 Tax=Planotetraspora sp. A-T 1434 TaxID=2979219 RepID=UPI0021C09A15|nr:DUF742 domain-containing protein [Planotetraspora sp. A-T 1434]MCT9934844.1 DUF742 domain-containing protein [Planotetraspora sp. A-T 1434]
MSGDPMESEMDTEEEWVDDGPVVRAYALTRGRVTPSSPAALDLTAIVAATGAALPDHADLGSEHRRLLGLLPRARPLADVASDSGLPLGVVRVLLGDLLDHGLVLVRPPAPAGAANRMESILQEVISGLRAL